MMRPSAAGDASRSGAIGDYQPLRAHLHPGDDTRAPGKLCALRGLRETQHEAAAAVAAAAEAAEAAQKAAEQAASAAEQARATKDAAMRQLADAQAAQARSSLVH